MCRLAFRDAPQERPGRKRHAFHSAGAGPGNISGPAQLGTTRWPACLLHQFLQAALEHEDLILFKVSGFKR